MKTRIRQSVFETNSSSVHTIAMKTDEIYKSELNIQGPYVYAECHDYSNVGKHDSYYITGQQEKLDYLMSWICMKHYYSNHDESLESTWEYNAVLNAIQMVVPNVCVIKIKNPQDADFDHQTAPYNYNDCVVNLYDEKKICDFIFNKNIMIECYFD